MRLGAVLLVLCLGVGCKSTPIFEYSLDVPAQTLALPGSPPVRDGRPRFREILCAVLAREPAGSTRPCDGLLHRLSDEPDTARLMEPPPKPLLKLSVLFVPGLLGDCAYSLAPPFQTAMKRLRQLGYDVRISQVNASTHSHANAERLAQEIAGIPAGRLVLVGHARGAVDILELLVTQPSAASRVQAVLSVAGAINGSPLASSPRGAALLFEHGQDSACTLGEREALADLEPAHRLRWLMDHPLPSGPMYFSLAAFRPARQMVAPLRRRATALATIEPRNDGLLPFFDQVIPGSELLGYVDADHWSIAGEDAVLEAALLRITEALAREGGR